jgi:excisionase family DNA binding protein
MTNSDDPQAANACERLVYSVTEVGQVLGISRAFAYELVARGDLPSICLGRRRLVPKVALLAFIGDHQSNEQHRGEERSPSFADPTQLTPGGFALGHRRPEVRCQFPTEGPDVR